MSKHDPKSSACSFALAVCSFSLAVGPSRVTRVVGCCVRAGAFAKVRLAGDLLPLLLLLVVAVWVVGRGVRELLGWLVLLLMLLLLLARVLLVVWLLLMGGGLVLVRRVVVRGGVLWVAALLIRLAGTWGEASRREVTFWLALGVTGSVVLPGARDGPCSTA